MHLEEAAFQVQLFGLEVTGVRVELLADFKVCWQVERRVVRRVHLAEGRHELPAPNRRVPDRCYIDCCCAKGPYSSSRSISCRVRRDRSMPMIVVLKSSSYMRQDSKATCAIENSGPPIERVSGQYQLSLKFILQTLLMLALSLSHRRTHALQRVHGALTNGETLRAPFLPSDPSPSSRLSSSGRRCRRCL